MEDAEPFGNGRRRLPDLYLLGLFDIEKSELDVFRERMIMVPSKNGIGPDRVGGELFLIITES
jgi:hypothetical protein